MGKALDMEIMGIQLPLYLLITAVTAAAMAVRWLPSGMLGALLVMDGVRRTVQCGGE